MLCTCMSKTMHLQWLDFKMTCQVRFWSLFSASVPLVAEVATSHNRIASDCTTPVEQVCTAQAERS